MKLNLHCGSNNREGYENLDFRIDPTHSYISFSSVQENSVDEIIVNTGCLESLSRQELSEAFTLWFKLLKPKGEIKIHFVDIYIFTNNLQYNRLNIFDFENEIINSDIKTVHDMNSVTNYINAVGFKINTANYYDRLGIIHAQK